MPTAKATLSNFRQSPRRMRLVANLVRGKKVVDVLVNLDFTEKKAATPIKTLIASALANAKSMELPTENLIVKTIRVDAGQILKRRRPAARGSAHPISKRTSQIFVELGEGSKGAKGAKANTVATLADTRAPGNPGAGSSKKPVKSVKKAVK